MMTHPAALSISAVTFALAASLASAQSIPADRVSDLLSSFEAGILCAPVVVATRPAPDTVAGVTNVVEDAPDFVATTRDVPAVIGVGFGIRAEALADIPFVTMVVTHPPMAPSGQTRQSYETSIASDGGSISFYQLEYGYELVVGKWTFTALDGDEVIYSASFNVVPPQQVPELAGVCNYQDLLS